MNVLERRDLTMSGGSGWAAVVDAAACFENRVEMLGHLDPGDRIVVLEFARIFRSIAAALERHASRGVEQSADTSHAA